MLSKYFSNILPELSARAARATISKLGFSNPPLRRHLFEVFARGYGEPGCFLGDPVFEATFGWTQANTSFGALAKTLIHPKLVDAMDKPWGDSGKEYQFPRAGRPYTHQLQAWKALLGPGFQSVVVTSGTGSGKTECFMVPVLSSIATELDKQESIEGVRALFLYPLNALIQSQRERLRAWTGPFGGEVRFCLYNGMTPEEAKAELYREAPRLQRPGYCIASVAMQDGTCRSWAVQDESTVLPDRNWGQSVERPAVVSASESPKLSEQVVRLPNPAAGGSRTIEVTRQLDGSGSGFGQRFWKLLGNGSISNALPAGKFVASVDYEDRYLATPLACAILVEVISSLKSYFEHIDAWESPYIRVTTMIVDQDRSPRYKDQWSSDWPSSELRDAAVGSAFDYCGMPAVIRSLPKFELIHGRRLLVSFTDGSQFCVVPDQGFSYWRLARSQARSPLASFSMDQSTDLQGQRIAEIKVGIEGNDLPTLVSTDRVFGES